MGRKSLRTLRFAGCALDLARMSLRRGHEEVVLRPKAFDVLHHLAENPGHLIAKDELIEKVWASVVVTDGSLVQCIKEIREAIGDDKHRIIKTVQRRGYLFNATVTEDTELPPTAGPTLPIRYAKSGELHVAYQVFGAGPVDLVFVPGFISHLEMWWEEPSLARWFHRLGESARVILFDKRGTGLSDRVKRQPSMDERIDDVRAVMDAVGIERAAVMGISDGGSLSALFAATHPERCQALVLWAAFAQFKSWFPTEESLQHFFRYVETSWGSGASLPKFAPSKAGDTAFQAWWGRFERLGANPAAAIEIMRMSSQIDVTDILPTINVPTLVIHRTGDVTVNVEAGRLLAARIPKARYVEFSGIDHFHVAGTNGDEMLDVIVDFLADLKHAPAADRVLATVLVTEIVDAQAVSGHPQGEDGQEPLLAPDQIVAQELARFRGRKMRSTATGFLAAFDGPARAVLGGLAVKGALERLGIAVRMGIHTGEVELTDDELRGNAVQIAAHVARHADQGDVVVSRTVKDLTAGAGITFDYLDTHTLEGVPDTWQLYRASV